MVAAKRPKASPEAQHAKFVEAAKRLETDDDPERFKETVKRLAKMRTGSAPGNEHKRTRNIFA